MKLIRSATSWSTANNAAVDKPLAHVKFVGHRKLIPRPTMLAAPTISVKTISVAEKWPDIILAHPSKKSQINVIRVNQIIKQGTAAHLAAGC